MAIKNTIDGIKNLAVGMENLELISKLIDLQSQAYEILDENRELRLELERIKRQDELIHDLEYVSEVYYKKSDGSGPYCFLCWGTEKLLVNAPVARYSTGLKAHCKNCKNLYKVPIE